MRMIRMIKIFAALWLSLGLAVAPLQAAAIAAPAGDAEPCAMTGSKHALSEQHEHAQHGQESCSDCENCQQHDCGSDGCPVGMGCGYHMQPAVMTSLHSGSRPQLASEHFIGDSSLVTRTDPPLLRPPL